MKLQHRLTRFSLCLVLLMSLMAMLQPLVAEGSRYTLKIENASAFDIHRLYLSSAEDESWGRDLLGSHIMRSGSTFAVTDITPGEYDVKLVDEDGDFCTVRNVNFFRNTSWTITNEWLLGCEFH